MASLGSAADSDSPAEAFHHVVRDGHGRYFAVSGFPVTRILVYNSDGDLEAVWGRGGEGPGEYQTIRQLLMLRGDSLGVLDPGSSRLTILNSDGSVARTQGLAVHPFEIAQLDNGTLVVAGRQYTASGSGYAMHVVRPDGSARRFGPAVTVLPTRPSASLRRLAAAGETVWAARPDRYELTEYAADGTPLRVLKREADWFPERETEGAVDFAKEPPFPFLADVHVDEEGLVWTLVRLAADDWAPVDDPGLMPSWGRYFDSIVEVIDPDRGLVVRSQRFPWYGHRFTNDGLVVSHREDILGVLVLDIWRLER